MGKMADVAGDVPTSIPGDDSYISDLIASAAEASEYFGDDVLEAFADAGDRTRQRHLEALELLREMLGVLNTGHVCRIEPTSAFADKLRRLLRED